MTEKPTEEKPKNPFLRSYVNKDTKGDINPFLIEYQDAQGNRLTAHRFWDNSVLHCANNVKEQALPATITNQIRDEIRALFKDADKIWDYKIRTEFDLGDHESPLKKRCDLSRDNEVVPRQ